MSLEGMRKQIDHGGMGVREAGSVDALLLLSSGIYAMSAEISR
jgi:hypothetical protein